MAMKVKTFTTPFAGKEGFDSKDVNEFIGSNNVAAITTRFLEAHGMTWLAVCVVYDEMKRDETTKRGEPRDPVRSALSPDDQATYEVVRKWRNALAERLGRTPFTLLNNREVAEVARRRPRSTEELSAVSGIGRGKIRLFGDELLDLLRGLTDQVPSPAERPSCAESGVPFLGFRIWPNQIRLDPARSRRFHRKMKQVEFLVREGRLDEDAAAQKAASLQAWAAQADSLELRRRLVVGMIARDRESVWCT